MLSFNATATSNFLLRSSPSTHRQLETMLCSRHLMLFFMVMFSSNLITPAPALSREGLDLLHFKSTLYDPDNSLQDWNPSDATPCNWTGIHCSLDSPTVTSIELPDLSLNGPFHPLLCTLPSLTRLDLSFNYINSTLLPSSLLPCSSLTHLKLSQNLLVGALPSTLPDLPSLRWLDLSGNNFSGDIPESFARFPKLEGLSLVQNLLNGTVPGFLGNITSLKDLNLSFNPFSAGVLPSEFGNLSSLETLWVAGCNLIGVIPSSIGDLRSLRNFDVSRNELEGRIPETMTRLSSVFQIELFANNLAGEIPNGFGNLTLLRNFDASMNRLQGTIPSDIFDLPLLQSLNLYQNQLFGEIPAAIVKVKTLRELRLFQNNLTGVIPSDLGKNQPLVFVDISQNRLSGEIPNGICDMGLLEYLMTIDNNLSGGLPESLKRCKTMRRLRLSKNFLSGDVPDGVWSLPHVSLFDLAVNSLTGNISEAISGAYNISSLIIFDNNFTGRIPKELGTLSKLETLSAGDNHLIGPLPASIRHLSDLSKLDLHNNDLSGQLPSEIGSLARLTELNLGKNRFTGKIPSEIGNLPVLNYLDLSNNELTGEIPRELQNLTLNSFNFSNNQLSGTIPPLYADESYKDRFVGNPGLCAAMADLCPRQNTKNNRKKANAWIFCMIFVLTGIVMVVGLGWFYSRYRNLKRSKKESKNASKWTVTSFHKLDFVEYEILDNLDEDNLIGTGASGNVYKVPLMNGGTVAVKKIWSKSKKPGIDGNQGEQEQEEARDLGDDSFEAEVSTLGKIRHKCIVKLWCCCTHNDSKSKLLVYEHMANGSLGDLLHGKKKGVLDWHTRHRIAVDAAEGLSYLHHDCVPAIVHRDVKSNNILLDSELRGKVADFGVAKTFEVVGKCPKSMSVIAGSCGYIAPEYAYTLRVNEKSDIYSFGVVILELVTGRAAVDPKFGEKDLVKWVRGLLEEENGVEIAVDPKLDLKSFKDEISKVLDIGLQCTSTLPINRPSMRRVVKMLLQVTDGNQVSDGGRYSNNPKKIQSPYYYDYEQDV